MLRGSWHAEDCAAIEGWPLRCWPRDLTAFRCTLIVCLCMCAHPPPYLPCLPHVLSICTASWPCARLARAVAQPASVCARAAAAAACASSVLAFASSAAAACASLAALAAGAGQGLQGTPGVMYTLQTVHLYVCLYITKAAS